MIWKMAHACDVHEVMTYEVRVQAQRSAIQPRKQQCELRFWDTPPTEMFLIPFFSLPWISLSCLIHPQFSMKNQPSLGPLHSPYFSIITCPPKHIEKQNPAGVWRMKGAERSPSGRGGKPEILIIVSIPTGKVKVTQSCPTLCHPMDYTVHGILQARILERVAFPFSRGSSQPRDQTQVSRIAGRFFTSWATREAQISTVLCSNAPNNTTTWCVLHLLLLLLFTRWVSDLANIISHSCASISSLNN